MPLSILELTMKLFRFLSFVFVALSSTAFASPPSFNLDSNEDQRSFHLTLENTTSHKMLCSLIEITANIGNGDCTELVASFKFAIKNQEFKSNSKIENSNVGIDYLAQQIKVRKNAGLIYCGQPEITFNCK